MKKKILSFSAALTLLMLVFALAFTASAAEIDDIWSGRFEPINNTAGADLTVSGPSSVYLGDSFDVTFAWNNINFDSYRTGSIDIYFYFDARFVEIPEGAIALVELGDTEWENYGDASVSAVPDNASDYMKLMKVAIVIPDDYTTTANKLTVTVKFNAVAPGTSEFDWFYAAIAAYADSTGEHYVEVANALTDINVDLTYDVTVLVREAEALLSTNKSSYAHDEPIIITTTGDIDGKYVGIANENGKMLGFVPASDAPFTLDDPAWTWNNGFSPDSVADGKFTIGWVDSEGNWIEAEAASRITITVNAVPDTSDGADAFLIACVAISAITVLAIATVDSKRRYNN